jgi:glycolate oxidase FAD binding subunit
VILIPSAAQSGEANVSEIQVNPTVNVNTSIDAAQLVERCLAQRLPIVNYGRMHAGLGNPPPAQHVALEASGDVIEHYQRDFTIRAAAGITMGRLNEVLLAAGQFAPIDAPADITLGEVIAHHVYGPLRLGYGSVRDHLLGLRYIDGAGRDIHVGGRTVKNVAGYDMTRLMVGSLNELGILHEATLRTFAAPEHAMVVDISVQKPHEIDLMLGDWLLADAAPAWMLLHHSAGQWSLKIGYYGASSACNVQLSSLETMLDGHPTLRIVGSGGATLGQDLAEREARANWRRQAPALIKVVVPPVQTGVIAAQLVEWLVAPPLQIDALPAHGCLFVGGNLNDAQARTLDAKLLEQLAAIGGFRVWHQRPAGAADLPPFAPAATDYAMLSRIKATMDPHGLFNPGRYLPAKPQE